MRKHQTCGFWLLTFVWALKAENRSQLSICSSFRFPGKLTRQKITKAVSKGNGFLWSAFLMSQGQELISKRIGLVSHRFLKRRMDLISSPVEISGNTPGMSLTLHLADYSKGKAEMTQYRGDMHRNARSAQSTIRIFLLCTNIHYWTTKIQDIFHIRCQLEARPRISVVWRLEEFITMHPINVKIKFPLTMFQMKGQNPKAPLNPFSSAFPTHSLCFGQQ